MDLNGIAGPVVGAVNPRFPVTVQISTGATTAADGSRTPQYATPGAFTGSIAGNVLTVTAQSQGSILPGQTIAGAGVVIGTQVVEQLTGTPGGIGTYEVTIAQTVDPSVAMSAELVLVAQIQPITWRDLQMTDGVNLGGVKWKAYLHGEVDSVVRPEKKGGDLIIIASGRHQGTWLVLQVLEQFPDWVCAAIALQNGG